MKNRNLFLIVEGPDNSGKSTLIKKIKSYYSDYTLQSLHFSSVKHKSLDDCINYNKKLYNMMFDMMIFSIKYDKSGILMDRSHLGELVYGPLYRDYAGEYVLDIEKNILNIHDVINNFFLITLVDKPENLISREDGESISIDLNNKNKEIQLFKEAHNKSLIKNKLIINIENKDANEVFEEVKIFLNSKGYE